MTTDTATLFSVAVGSLSAVFLINLTIQALVTTIEKWNDD